jgi:hypothetical protein
MQLTTTQWSLLGFYGFSAFWALIIFVAGYRDICSQILSREISRRMAEGACLRMRIGWRNHLFLGALMFTAIILPPINTTVVGVFIRLVYKSYKKS